MFSITGKSSDSALAQEQESGEKKLLKMKKQRKASFRGGDTGVADSVFELEEIDDNELYQKQQQHASSFLRDDDAGYGDDNTNSDNDNDTDHGLTKSSSSPNGMTSILKKRNSNVGKLGDSPSANAAAAAAMAEPITRQISIGKKTKSGILAKYSFSLPRDIPFMGGGGGGHRLTTLPINKIPQVDGESDEEENDHSNQSARTVRKPMIAGEKENTVAATGHEDLSFMINDSVNMNDSDGDEDNDDDDDDDDDLFRTDKHTGEELQNMGQAISNLASSIVQKDGRELFGGVPSRRIPINSISKSCFD